MDLPGASWRIAIELEFSERHRDEAGHHAKRDPQRERCGV